MLRIENGDKRFNKGKPNEIHVVNDTTIAFPDTGLVAILGPSGSGKTTLLYCLGGLETLDGGTVYHDQVPVTRKNFDALRAEKIGFVFQNYFLLPELTVEENLAVVLDMFVLTPEEKTRRIKESLKAVGMERFLHRLPSQLSGGQQQRVAIARALVKNPGMIIADEPTGNLDEANTLQVMDIFKAISTTRLVLIVTHEESIASFYADRIVTLSDGMITADQPNAAGESYRYTDDPHIWLGDYTKSESGAGITFYRDASQAEPFSARLILRDGTYYLDSSVPVHLLDPHEGLVREGVHPEKTREGKPVTTDIDFPKAPLKAHAVSWHDAFRAAWKSLFTPGRGKKKGYLAAFFITSLVAVIASAFAFSVFVVKPEDYLTCSRQGVTVLSYEKTSAGERNALIESGLELSISAFHPGVLTLDRFPRVAGSASGEAIEIVAGLPAASAITIGVNATEDAGAVADATWIDSILKDSTVLGTGYHVAEDFIGTTFENGLTIVGIASLGEMALYVGSRTYATLFASHFSTTTASAYGAGGRVLIYEPLPATVSSYTNLEGTSVDLAAHPLANGEVIVPNDAYYTAQASAIATSFYASRSIGGHRLSIVGTYTPSSGTDVLNKGWGEVAYGTAWTVSASRSDLLLTEGMLVVHTEDLATTEKTLQGMGFKTVRMADYLKRQARKARLSSRSGALVLAAIGLVSAMLFIYFMIRASLIARIYPIGVERALGLGTEAIARVFLMEILLTNVFCAVAGFLLILVLLGGLKDLISVLSLNLTWYMALAAWALCLICSLVVGMIPVLKFASQSPAKALTHYDL